MSTAVALLNIALGAVYLQYGILTAIEMRRDWSRLGFTHFGAAWVFMAFTCGPHHMTHGVHGLFEGRMGGPADLIAVAIGAPAGIIWWLLRLEAFRGGAGDRHIKGTPLWIMALPTLAGVYVTALVAMAIAGPSLDADNAWIIVANVLLVPIYGAIGYLLMRTQLRNRAELQGWSVSGLSLGIVFPTCALMHGVYAYYTLNGRYGYDTHGFVIDWLSVPAALYFLWVVHGLYRETIVDWNHTTGTIDTSTARATAA